jgi:hypothetical protein
LTLVLNQRPPKVKGAGGGRNKWQASNPLLQSFADPLIIPDAQQRADEGAGDGMAAAAGASTAWVPSEATLNVTLCFKFSKIKPIQDRIELLDATKNDLEASIAKLRLSKT